MAGLLSDGPARPASSIFRIGGIGAMNRPATSPATCVLPTKVTGDPESSAFAERYSRQILLNGIGVAGQHRLATARVLIVGVGGLGSPCGLYLAAAGVGTIVVVDADRVELSNLQRQILHRDVDIGCIKVHSAAQTMHAMNSDVRVVPIAERIDEATVAHIVRDVDVVVDGCDNFATRFVVADHCWRLGVPLITAGITQWAGQLFTVVPGPNEACFRCLVPDVSAQDATCRQAGVLGAAVGVLGTLQAVETVKLITGVGETLSRRLLTFDALSYTFRCYRRWPMAGCSHGACEGSSIAPHVPVSAEAGRSE